MPQGRLPMESAKSTSTSGNTIKTQAYSRRVPKVWRVADNLSAYPPGRSTSSNTPRCSSGTTRASTSASVSCWRSCNCSSGTTSVSCLGCMSRAPWTRASRTTASASSFAISLSLASSKSRRRFSTSRGAAGSGSPASTRVRQWPAFSSEPAVSSLDGVPHQLLWLGKYRAAGREASTTLQLTIFGLFTSLSSRFQPVGKCLQSSEVLACLRTSAVRRANRTASARLGDGMLPKPAMALSTSACLASIGTSFSAPAS
mmetsp:Transcript_4474/g.14439  ORF Transcript_4474/g.14439 Transcript_4474/m.14439 type:complete len:257 (-) Transcript_4474:261-1031(-)